MQKILYIAIGGAVGTLARYGTGTLLSSQMQRTGFPWATLAVNLCGCFLIGYLNGIFAERVPVSAEIKAGLLIGVLGGFTTFSSFGYETMTLFQARQMGYAIANILANNVIGLLLAFGGYALGHGKM